jgi:hypothetical protein
MVAGSLTRLRVGSCALRNGQAGSNYRLMLRWRARRAVHLDPCAARQHGQAGSGSRELVAGVGLFLRLRHPG